MNTMNYNGYAAHIEYEAEDRIFVGHLSGIYDTVGFQGSSVEELETSFHEAVDNYLTACAKLGQQPNKPASGKMLLRVPPAIHSVAMMFAESEGKSLNQWAAHVLAEAAQSGIPSFHLSCFFLLSEGK
ncbi:MAG: type II toxin-antitoxin system HicB family antitoxin [Deltaproteobacteria bacterium]